MMMSNSNHELYKPTIKDILLLPLLGDVQVNNEGTKVAYRKGNVNFKDNKIDSYCCIYDCEKEKEFLLTQTGTAMDLHWINNETLAMKKTTESTGAQIFLFEGLIGEGFQVTDHPGGIENFCPFTGGFVFIARNLDTDERKKREARFGQFIHTEQETSSSSLFYVDPNKVREYRFLKTQSFPDEHNHNLVQPVINLGQFLPEPFKIESIVVSPNQDSVYINCRSKEDLIYEHETSHFRIQFDPNMFYENPTKFQPVVTRIDLPKGAKIKAISPDGSKLLIWHKKRDLRDFTQADLWILNTADLRQDFLLNLMVCITDQFDQDPLTHRICWTKAGIFISYWEESQTKVARLTEEGMIEPIDLHGFIPNFYFHVNDLGYVSFLGFSQTTIQEAYLNVPTDSGRETRSLTNFNDLVSTWDLGTVESIKWISKDGTEIEGILRKPSNFDPTRKYPLLIDIHGGPHASSANVLLEGMDKFYYPLVQFSNKEILILKPNYRGSIGKGQLFKELLVNNVGIGDLWDVESGIDYLTNQGFIDETKIGTCGGSQGAYISAFVAMHSDRFCAASGCSTLASWVTYFNGSDSRYSIPFFGDKSYRNNGPYDKDMAEVFERTAPISGIINTNTPFLLQHGENDERVPLHSSKIIYRALKEKGVATELFTYPGMGHAIAKPRENYAVLVQNYRWFLHHLLGEKLDFYKTDEAD